MTLHRAGVCVHVSSLSGGYGIGNFGGGARELIDWMADAGVAVWQFLPLGPTGHGNSPYQLLSAFAGNPLFIDPDGLVELGLLDSADLPASEDSTSFVDYGSVIAIQVSLLRRAASNFERIASPALRHAYRTFVAMHSARWLDDFAMYSTLKREHDQAPWTQWRTRFRDRDGSALARWRADHAASLEAERIVQFLYFYQWRALRAYAARHGIQLFADVPIYLPHDCADAWARRELLELDDEGQPVEVAGVPPDYFSDEGQRWGNPLYAWDHHAAEDYSWWIERLRHAFECADMLRLDHFRGFEAYWAIPADKSAREGHWRAGPGYGLFDAIRRELGECSIIAEDLGIITDEVTTLRRAFGMPGMQVLQFLVGEEGFNPDVVGEDCVCYTGTHDNDTVLGWFQSSARREPEAQRALQDTVCRQLACSPDDVANAMIRLALSTRAQLAVLPVQDILELGSAARMNTPGSVGDNWTWRLKPGQLDAGSAARIRAMIESEGRLVPVVAREVRE